MNDRMFGACITALRFGIVILVAFVGEGQAQDKKLALAERYAMLESCSSSARACHQFSDGM